MKAAILNQSGDIPHFGDFAEPVPAEGQEILIVKAASIKNLDKMIAKGSHYHKTAHFPTIPGVDGVGVTENGTRVYAGASAPFGMIAEKTVIRKGFCVPVPDGLDDVTAAAIPNPAVSAWLSLHYRGQLKKGNTVLILGATGITGNLAVQLALQLGAGKIIAVGRNEYALQRLSALGAVKTVQLSEDKAEAKRSFKDILKDSPVDIVLDYLWGSPAESLLDALSGNDLQAEAHTTRYIQIGEMAGPTITLPGAVLRSAGIELYGAGGGSISKEIMQTLFTEIVPDILRMAADGKLHIETEVFALKDIATAWSSTGKRVVIVP